MIKYLKFSLIALFPYLIVIILLMIFLTPSIIESVFQGNIFILLAILLIIFLVALAFSLVTFISSLFDKKKAVDLTRVNMVIKLIQIPAYLILFIIGMLSMITIFTMGIGLFLIVLNVLSITLTGLIGLGGVVKMFREKRLQITEAVIYAILQFVFCADVICSIVMYIKAKKEIFIENN